MQRNNGQSVLESKQFGKSLSAMLYVYSCVAVGNKVSAFLNFIEIILLVDCVGVSARLRLMSQGDLDIYFLSKEQSILIH